MYLFSCRNGSNVDTKTRNSESQVFSGCDQVFSEGLQGKSNVLLPGDLSYRIPVNSENIRALQQKHHLCLLILGVGGRNYQIIWCHIFSILTAIKQTMSFSSF